MSINVMNIHMFVDFIHYILHNFIQSLHYNVYYCTLIGQSEPLFPVYMLYCHALYTYHVPQVLVVRMCCRLYGVIACKSAYGKA